MGTAYWVVAGVLALAYLASGAMKATRPMAELRKNMAWVDSMPERNVRAIGGLEVLGAIGLILPPLVGIAEWLSVAAALGLVAVQVGAMRLHMSRDETKVLPANAVLLILAVAAAILAIRAL